MNSMARFSRKINSWQLVVFVLLGMAAVVRYVALGQIPPGLWYDEALYCMSALSIGDPGYPIFFMTGGHPHEPLFVYSLRAWFGLFGISVISARSCMATWGLLTVAVMWPLAQRLLGSRPWATAAVAVIAFMRWPLHFSRTIFRAGLAPLFISLTFLLFLRWRERKRAVDAILCGVVMGIGSYTYLSFRLVPVIWTLWVLWLLKRKCLSWKEDAAHLMLIVLCAVATFAPLGCDWLRHPDHFSGRTDEVSMFVTHNDDGTTTNKTTLQVAHDIAANTVAVAGAWFVKGDHVGKHNLPLEPVFDPITGIIFLIGFLWCVRRCPKNETAFLLLIWFLILCATSVLSFGAPNILRMQGAIPPVILMFIIGLRIIYTQIHKRLGTSQARLIIGGVLVIFSCWQLDTYFRRFPKHPDVRREFLADSFIPPAQTTMQALSSDLAKTIWVPEEIAEHTTFEFITWTRKSDVKTYTPQEKNITTDTKALVIATRHSLDSAAEQQREAIQKMHPVFTWTVPITDENGNEKRIPWGFFFRPIRDNAN